MCSVAGHFQSSHGRCTLLSDIPELTLSKSVFYLCCLLPSGAPSRGAAFPLHLYFSRLTLLLLHILCPSRGTEFMPTTVQSNERACRELSVV